MRAIWLAVAVLIASNLMPAQEWIRTERTDAFRGTRYVQFELAGHFLTPPRDAGRGPRLVVQCLPGEHSVGYHVFKNGRTLAAYLIVGPVLDSHLSRLTVQYRLNDGKIQTEIWGISTDFSGAFFGETTLNNLLYGHIAAHKENSTPPVSKVVIATDEFAGGEIVMQFDMPNPDALAEACGIVYHRQ